MGVTVKDKNRIPRVLAELLELKRIQTRIGLIATKCGADVVEYAAIQEFGGGNVPERSFIRSAATEASKTAEELCVDGVRAVITGKASGKDVYEKVGLFLQERIVSKINEQIPPPLAESTVKRKGTTKTLVDTGTMRKGVSYIVGER